jgi:hypothetical protein
VNIYTEHVVEAAQQEVGSVQELYDDAARALLNYFLIKRGMTEIDESVSSLGMYRLLPLVTDAWNTEGEDVRMAIRQLAALTRLCLSRIDLGRKWEHIMLAVGDDFAIMDNWPELDELPSLFARRPTQQRPPDWSHEANVRGLGDSFTNRVRGKM